MAEHRDAEKPHLPPNQKLSRLRSKSDMVSYEDLLIAQYLEDLRKSKGQMKKRSQPSPYAERVPHSILTPRRPFSANVHGRQKVTGKPKIEAKFIADTNLWDPATPTTEQKLQGPARRNRPFSAPVKYNRGYSASSYQYYIKQYRPKSGRRMKPLFKRQPNVIVVNAFKNGYNDKWAKVAAGNIKELLEYCTERLELPFAARRIFMEYGVEIFDARDIPKHKDDDGKIIPANVYISMGENYKDPGVSTKRNLILRNGAVWTLSGIILPEAGKKKTTKAKMSKRMRLLIEKKRVRIIVYRNGKCKEPCEVVADLEKMDEFLVSCTAQLDLTSHARIVYDLDGHSVTDLSETPILDDCLQSGGTPVLGPLWISIGEGFSPSGTQDFLLNIRQVVKGKLKEAKKYKKELEWAKDGDTDNVTIPAVLIVTEDDMYEALDKADNDVDQLTEALERLDEKIKNIEEKTAEEESKGVEYKMQHIQKLDFDDRLVGRKGLRLKVNENGTADNEDIFYFNIGAAMKGIDHDNERLMQRLLDELSFSHRMENSQNPKLAAIAQCLFDKFGHEITDVHSLKYDQQVWVGYGEAFISPFTYCVQLVCDKTHGFEIYGERRAVLREQLMTEEVQGKEQQSDWDVNTGYPDDYEYTMVNPEIDPIYKQHVDSQLELGELDINGHYMQMKERPKVILYPEVAVGQKLKRGHVELWPADAQSWLITKTGYILNKAMPQLCLAMSETKIEANLSGKGTNIEAYVVKLEKRQSSNGNQKWRFNTNGTIGSEVNPDLMLTCLGSRVGDNESLEKCNVNGSKAGNKVYLVVTDAVGKKDAACQRWAIKQERLDILGQWKHTDASNPEFNKQAYSWPVTSNGDLNEKYEWPMEGFLIPNAPLIRKGDKKSGLSGMTAIRLNVLKNGEKDYSQAIPVVGPNLTNMIKDIGKKTDKSRKNRRNRLRGREYDVPKDSVEDEISACNTTVREMEFRMFLDSCTSLMDMPFAARRMFDGNGKEIFMLSDMTRDQLVFVSCGETWVDPNLTKAEQQRRHLLSQLATEVAKIRQFCALRNPEGYVMQVDGALVPNAKIITNQQWKPANENDEETPPPEGASAAEEPQQEEEEEDDNVTASTAHHRSHQTSDQRHERLKWPWERLINVSRSFDGEDMEAQKYTDRELYEKYKPRPSPRMSHDSLQRFVYEDSFIACCANHNLVLSIQEYEGRVLEVTLAKRRPDEISQRWVIRENGEIRSKRNQQLALTVSTPNISQNETEVRPLTFYGCNVTLQSRKVNEYGRAHQRWRYDAETGYIHAFFTDALDKEITSANKSDVCTYAVTGSKKLDQPGYMVEIPVPMATERMQRRRIMVCTSCARAMRGRFKLEKLSGNVSFHCAMNEAKKLKLKQVGSFNVLNGKVDLSTHEAEITLGYWEERMRGLKEETSVRAISKEINAARGVRSVKILAYKNGEGRMRQGETIIGSSMEGLLQQCTTRLGLNNAARRFYTEDGTLVIEKDDLIDWAVENYKSEMAVYIERMIQQEDGDEPQQEAEDVSQSANLGGRSFHGALKNLSLLESVDEEGLNEYAMQNSARERPEDEQPMEMQATTETDQQESAKEAKRKKELLENITLPPLDVILKYPIEVWVSSSKPFVSPEVVESKAENRKKKRVLRAAVSMELDAEKHILRLMKGRRLEEQKPGEYKGTRNSQQPVVIEGHWQQLTSEEETKHDVVHKLQTHLAEVKANQSDGSLNTVNVNTTRRLYKQPNMKRVLVYPNGQSIERAIYAWGESMEQILNCATTRLNLYSRAKILFNAEGQQIDDFDAINRDELLCASTGKSFARPQACRQDVEVKANWSRARKQYGPTATDITVDIDKNPNVDLVHYHQGGQRGRVDTSSSSIIIKLADPKVDPFGPPMLAKPQANQSGQQRLRPPSAKGT